MAFDPETVNFREEGNSDRVRYCSGNVRSSSHSVSSLYPPPSSAQGPAVNIYLTLYCASKNVLPSSSPLLFSFHCYFRVLFSLSIPLSKLSEVTSTFDTEMKAIKYLSIALFCYITICNDGFIERSGRAQTNLAKLLFAKAFLLKAN